MVVFSRKYRWPEHYFSVCSLGNSQKLLKTNQVSVGTMFLKYGTKYEYLFFHSFFNLFSIIVKEVNQIKNNVVRVVARLAFLFCFALTTGRCSTFQHNFVNQRKSEFYGPYFQTMLFLVTMLLPSFVFDTICG